MSGKNKFLLPSTSSSSAGGSSTRHTKSSEHGPDNQLSVDTDFDDYWEEEARNPNRNRIRIGRQYQATVPQLLKQGDEDLRKLEEMEILTFCPKKSAKVSDFELDHYFAVAKSLTLFASLVKTRSLTGKDVTVADLNNIRQKLGLSLAKVDDPSSQHIIDGFLQTKATNSTSSSSATTPTTLTTATTSTSSSSSSSRNSANNQNNSDNSSTKKDNNKTSPTDSTSITTDQTKTNNNKTIYSQSTKSHVNNEDQPKSSSKNKNFDARITVYNFDEDFEDENSVQLDQKCTRSGAEVKPLKAKPILPSASIDPEAINRTNIGSLNFFKEGQLVLKLNHCQDHEDGKDRWVQSGEKVAPAKQKRHTKRANDKTTISSQNGSQSNSVMSSYIDDDSKNESTPDEDSKDSMNSYGNLGRNSTSSCLPSPSSKHKQKLKNNINNHNHNELSSPVGMSQNPNQPFPSPVGYNTNISNNNSNNPHNNSAIANNRAHGNSNKFNDNKNISPHPNPVIGPTATGMQWFSPDLAAAAVALFNNLTYHNANPTPMMDNPLHGSPMGQNNSNDNPITTIHNITNQNNNNNNSSSTVNNICLSSKPMDLSVDNLSPKQQQVVHKSTTRLRNRSKNS